MKKRDQPARLLSRDISQIRIAVAGLGKMGEYHVRAIQQLAAGESEEYYKSGLSAQTCKLELCGLCDPDPEKREQSLETFPMLGKKEGCRLSLLPMLGKKEGCRLSLLPRFGNWAELLETVKPDLAVIASPTPTHFDLTMASLSAGVHTFVEKPLVTTQKEFKQLDETAATQGCRLMSGHVERYNPAAIKLRTLLAEDKMDAVSYHFQRTQPHDSRIADDIVTDKLIHDLDLAQYFFGTVSEFELLDSKRVEGQTQEATVHLRHASGVEGTLFVSWLLADTQPCREVRITCRDGMSVIGDFSGKELHLNDQSLSCEVPRWVKSDNNQIKDELADFTAYCMVPDPALPRFEPLLQLAEIEQSIEIIEALIRQTQ